MQPGHGLQQLADRIVALKRQPDSRPYVLVIGAECARAAHVPTLAELRTSYGDDVDDPAALDALLWDVAVPPFFYDVANLARAGYFPVVVTTSYDRLLERALSDLGLRPGDQFTVTELGAGAGPGSGRGADSELRIVRLYGPLGADDISTDRLDTVTGHAPGTPLQVVLAGYEGECDVIVRWLEAAAGGDLWWVNPSDPGASHLEGDGWRGDMAVIEGDEASPETFFGQLALILLRIPAVDSLRVSGGDAGTRGDDWYNRQYAQNRLHQARTVKRAIEIGVSASSNDPVGQNQISYQRQEIGRLEQDLVSSEIVSALLNRYLATQKILQQRASTDPASVDPDTLSFIAGQIETLQRESTKAVPNRAVVSAAEASLQALQGTLGIATAPPGATAS